MPRIILVLSGLFLMFSGVASIFWQQELKYQLPTPVPQHYKSVSAGEKINATLLPPGKGYFLHFYNPDCPCSRFNARHVRSLLRAYQDSVRMLIVVPTAEDLAKAEKEFGAFDMVIDKDKTIAKACGVYSTPQAVIIDRNSSLFYRGNYNKSRYCTARASNFAELSLIAMLNHQPPPPFGVIATVAYGCELPSDHNDELELF